MTKNRAEKKTLYLVGALFVCGGAAQALGMVVGLQSGEANALNIAGGIIGCCAFAYGVCVLIRNIRRKS